MKNILTAVVMVIVLILPCLSPAAETGEPVIYVIKKGDTLWGLSERFVKDPYYWPDMWSKNSQITNPHLIYPGQRIRVVNGRLELAPKEQAKGAVKSTGKSVPVVGAVDLPGDVVEEKTFPIRGNESFLMLEDIKPAGYVIGVHHDRIMAGVDDIVFTDIGTRQGARSGDKFSVLRGEASVSHPLTNEIMGRKVIPLGTLQLTDVERTSSRAIIINNHQEIASGSYLVPYRDDRRREVSIKMPTRDLKGYIIESYSGSEIIVAGDIVHIDLGTAQGAEAGNMLYVVRDVPVDQRYTEGRVERLPQELLGALVILETNRKSAMALVVKSIDAIYKGDKIITQSK